jgi:UDP-2-acetamido-2,6-beta-L-arabino-hexul-4-ose reductase
MIKIGITGQNGFIGQHLYQTLCLDTEKYQLVIFKNNFFEKAEKLDEFVTQCNVIVHLAAMNRHSDPSLIYNTNIHLVKKLVASLKRTNSNAHVIMSSSSQEDKDNLYGKSKKEGREFFINWEDSSSGLFTGLIIPNVFGPFGKPNYNSVVATFCYKLALGEKPEVHTDSDLSLIYIGDLIEEIIKVINNKTGNNKLRIPAANQLKVSELLKLLKLYKTQYQDNGEIPQLKSVFQLNLFNTFRCYLDIKNHFPIKLKENTDSRGSFVEIIRQGIGGQTSYSTTIPGITRGNHFHIRKIERFAVIKGKALIQLRKIGTDDVLDFYLDGAEPAYVDMPIWYTHNIKNIGNTELITLFWINEPYNPENADTYFIKV